MHVINANNVRDALPNAVRYLMQFGHETQTRGGDALVSLTPVTIRYRYPKQHVLINRIRDANPFFHLIEAMWMLAGRDDGAFLDHYIKDFSKKFGTHGRIMDAYGYRWRRGLRYDQLHEIIGQLKKTPNTRQAVLQMWGAGRDDLMMPDPKPCNLTVSFHTQGHMLDMTVFNRSNDLVWGCCGANAVHFAILQEYIAGMTGMRMGHYWQITTNLHFYKEHRDKMFKSILDSEVKDMNLHVALKNPGEYGAVEPLVRYPDPFDDELKETMLYIDEMHKYENIDEIYTGNISNPFLSEVVIPMAVAHKRYKIKDYEGALETIKTVKAEDWKRAGKEWLERRKK